MKDRILESLVKTANATCVFELLNAPSQTQNPSPGPYRWNGQVHLGLLSISSRPSRVTSPCERPHEDNRQTWNMLGVSLSANYDSWEVLKNASSFIASCEASYDGIEVAEDRQGSPHLWPTLVGEVVDLCKGRVEQRVHWLLLSCFRDE